MNLSRRTFILAGLIASQPFSRYVVAKDFPKVLSEWDGEGMYQSFAREGTTFGFASENIRPVGFLAIDTQCPWCMKLIKEIIPLKDKVDIRFALCAALNRHSEPQATAILSSTNPLQKLLEHEEHFNDKDFRGLRYDATVLGDEVIREQIWRNTRIWRRSACRTIPFGVFKTASGEYRPIYSQMTAVDLESIFELNSGSCSIHNAC